MLPLRSLCKQMLPLRSLCKQMLPEEPVQADATVEEPVQADATVEEPVQADATAEEPVQADAVVAVATPGSKPHEELEDLPAPVATAATTIEEEAMQPQKPSHGAQAEIGDGSPSSGFSPPISAPAAAPTTISSAARAPVPEVAPGGYFVYTENEVFVDATVYPTQFRTVVKAPGSSGGKIATRFVYEAIASRLGTHPEALKIFSGGHRIRFGDTIAFEEAAPRGNGRLWVDVHFAENEVPSHLHKLRKEDNLLQSLQLRARPDDIRPADLVAARRRGLAFGEAINEIRQRNKEDNLVSVAVVQEPSGTQMPFLGGYRLKKDPSHVFLHAATQLRAPGDTRLEELQHGPLPGDGVSRRTQTYGVSRSCQTLRECSTQTARPDYEADETYDETVVAKPYFSSVQVLALQTERVVILQKMYRKWKARQVYLELFAARQAFLDRATAQAAAEEAEKQRLEEFERRRRATPRTADDFATLRRELEAWRAAEAARILADGSLSEVEKRAVLSDLTKKELLLLQELETLRREAVQNRRTRRFEDILALMTAPKQCGVVSVTTRAAERARELRELYLALTETPSSIEARLDVLLHIKWTVKEFDSPLTQQIVELVDRESDLLQRGRTACSLKGLRTRLEHLFKRFVATPEYNPAVDEVVTGQTFGAVAGGEAASTVAARWRLKPSVVL
ncbi:IQ and ubiquitin-like domain-containing protein [Trypanosoma conorhini]|uniref:IQ and ubiquitin-like domain-containing protein n=1 Tax=Trypanosoma conorhini TaxID=83891 RepID=A0A3S5IQK4_9TRYP|nr:IQ and ubiquitin-like domain-containing protein [Trypanosoma conorhini]RNF00787.1 IQ and ubiquitin-like domain-containing protein [Trypanosoma conorhini]